MTKIAVSQRQEVVDLCVSGWTRGEVAAEYGVTTDCIKVILKNKGVRLMGAKRGRSVSNDARNRAIAEMYRSGKTQCAVAAAFGMSSAGVNHVLKSLNVARHAPGTVSSRPDGEWKRTIARSDYPELVEMHRSGKTLEEVGMHYGVSRERIRQILADLGMDRMDGGFTIKQFKRVADKVAAAKETNEKTEARIRKTWDMSLDDYKAHVAEFGTSGRQKSPMAKYVNQRKNAAHRGIAWEFTFATWWKVWLDSGKWDQRALSKEGYVMARYGDGDTPYSPESVYICTQSQNAKDSFIVSPASVRFAGCNGANRVGTGIGYTAVRRGNSVSYKVQFRGKTLGQFPRPELARAAYLAAAAQYKESQS